MARVPGCEVVYEVANQWRERCLEQDTSLLWPASDFEVDLGVEHGRLGVVMDDLAERLVAWALQPFAGGNILLAGV